MLFINPVNKQYGGTLSRYVPLAMPMTIGILAGQMLRYGYSVAVHDEELQKIDAATIGTIVAGLKKPYVFGITVLTTQAARAYELSAMLKKWYPDCKIIVGGYHPTAVPEEVLSIDSIDFAVRGEGECTLIDLYKAIREGEQDFSSIRGISYKCKGSIIHTPERPLIENLDELPLFPYDLFLDQLKRTRSSKKYDWGFILTSRGCPYRCTYCSQRMMTGATYRFKSPGRVLEELRYLIQELGAKQVYFIDDNLTFNKERIVALCDALAESKLGKQCAFSLQTRADNFYPDVVPRLKAAGFTSVGFGMETGTNRLAAEIHKHMTIEQHVDAVRLAKEQCLDVNLFMVLGFPTETPEDRRTAFEIVKRMKPALVKFNNLLPYPGTPIYKSVMHSSRLNVKGSWENYTSSVSDIGRLLFQQPPLPYVPESASEWELIRDVIGYNVRMMLTPSMLVSVVRRKHGTGMLKLPAWWFLMPKEILSLLRTAGVLLVNLVIVLLPLRITEPMVNRLRPDFQKRVPKKEQTPYVPYAWSGKQD